MLAALGVPLFRLIAYASMVLVVVIAVLWYMIVQRGKDIAQLNRFAAAGNAQAPVMVDEITRLESVGVEYPSVVFHYTVLIPSREVDPNAIRESGLSWLKSNACGNPQVEEMVLEPGYSIKRSYKDTEGLLILELEMGSDACSGST